MVIHKSQGSTLMSANASKISNKLRNGIIVTITCIHSSSIAFKVSCSNLKMYNLKTNQAVLAPLKTAIVDFELKGNASFDELKNDIEPLCFIVHSMVYSDKKEFDNGVWEQLEKSPTTEMQLITLLFENKDFAMKSGNSAPSPQDDQSEPVKKSVLDKVPKPAPVPKSVVKPSPISVVKPSPISKAGRTSKQGPAAPRLLWTPINAPANMSMMFPAMTLPNQPLVHVHPLRIEFAPPFTPNNISVVQIKALSIVAPVAYKIQSNAATWKLLNCIPWKGILKPNQIETISFIVTERFSEREVINDDHAHFFQVHAINWPSMLSNFDPDLFNNLEMAKRGEAQVVSIAAEFLKGSEDETKRKTETITGFADSQKLTDECDAPTRYGKSTEQPEMRTSPKIQLTEEKNELTSRKGKVDKQTKMEKCIKGDKSMKAVEISQTKVTYKPPTGKKQSVLLACKNITPKMVAYKVQTNKKIYYNIKPYLGTLSPNETVHIDFEMLPSLNETELKNCAEHTFVLTAYANWKGDKNKVDTNILKVLEVKRQYDIQKITIDIVHEGITTSTTKTPSKNLSPISTRRETKTKSDKTDKMIISVEPTKLNFSGPYDGKRKLEVIKVQNEMSLPVAIKVQCNRTQFYIVTPGKTVLQPGSSVSVEIELNEKFGAAEFKKTDPGAHKFNIMASKWPKAIQRFDPALWSKIDKKDLQTLTIPVELS